MTPRITVSCWCFMGTLLSVSVGLCWCSLVLFVRSVQYDLVGATLSLFSVSQSCSAFMYGWSCLEHVSGLLWVDVSVMSSAYDAS